MDARGASGYSAAQEALRSRVGHPTSVRLHDVQPNPRNPRYPDDDPEVVELAETLKKVGQLQPAVVISREQYLAFYPELREELGPQRWVVGVGNRRLAASRLAERTALEVRVAADVETVDDFEDMVLIENLQRKALPPLLEAEQLQRRLNRPGQTTRTVGEAIGKSHAYVQQRLDLLRLIPEFQDLLRRGEVNVKTARWIGTKAADVQRTMLADGPPYGPSKAAHAGNPVSTRASSNGSSASEDQGKPADQHEHVGPTNGAVEEGVDPVALAGNPVSKSTDDGGASDRPTPPRSTPSTQSPTETGQTPAAGQPGPSDAGSSAGRPLEVTRASVVQLLDTALGELDRVLPAGGDGPVGAALAEAQRLLVGARSALQPKAK